MTEISKIKSNKIKEAITDFLINNEDFYYFYSSFINFYPDENIDTAGVFHNRNGMNLVYNTDFIESLTTLQIKYLLVHEYIHLLSDHFSRATDGNFDKYIANIAMDGIINTKIEKNIYSKVERPSENLILIETLLDKQKVKQLNENQEMFFEKVYELILEKNKNNPPPNGDSSNGNGDGSNGNGDNSDIEKGRIDEHNIGEKYGASADEQKVWAKQNTENLLSAAKTKGISTGEIEKIIKEITKSKKNYFKKLKTAVGTIKKQVFAKTYRKYNKKTQSNNIFKGRLKQGSEINLILDTSGSMWNELEKAAGYMYHDNLIINLFTCDTEVQGFFRIERKKELTKINYKGCGGTELQPAIDNIIKLKINRNPTVLITDGYCDKLNFNNLLGEVLILTVAQKTPISYENRKKYKEIVISNEN